MIEIKPCKVCGAYPDIEVVLGGWRMEMYCSQCLEGGKVRTISRSHKQYNEALNELIESWNLKQTADDEDLAEKPCKNCGTLPVLEVGTYDGKHILKLKCPNCESQGMLNEAAIVDGPVSGLVRKWNRQQERCKPD